MFLLLWEMELPGVSLVMPVIVESAPSPRPWGDVRCGRRRGEGDRETEETRGMVERLARMIDMMARTMGVTGSEGSDGSGRNGGGSQVPRVRVGKHITFPKVRLKNPSSA